MRIKIATAEHTEKLRTPAPRIVFPDVTRIGRFMQSETNYMPSMIIFFETVLGLVRGGGEDYRGIAHT